MLAFIGSGIIAGVLYTLYLHYSVHFHRFLHETLGIFDNALTKFLEYGLTPFLLFATFGSFLYAVFRVYQIRKINKINYAAKRGTLVNHILKAVYDAGKDGIRVTHIRDNIMPPYRYQIKSKSLSFHLFSFRRTSEDLALWNDCKDCVENYDSRIRTEERAIDGNEAIEYFVWISNFPYSEL